MIFLLKKKVKSLCDTKKFQVFLVILHTSNHDFIIGKEINGFFVVLVLFFEMVLLCSPDRLGVFRDLLVSASPMLELKVYTTTPGPSTNILIGLSRWLRGIKVWPPVLMT